MSDRKERDFYARDLEEQRSFLQYTWCNHCMEMDLGMVNPVEYELEGIIYVEGDCKKCGETVVTELDDEE